MVIKDRAGLDLQLGTLMSALLEHRAAVLRQLGVGLLEAVVEPELSADGHTGQIGVKRWLWISAGFEPSLTGDWQG